MGQLQKYVQQLASSENDPSVDITALSHACGERFEDLKLLLPRAVELAGTEGNGNTSEEKSNIVQRITDLQDQLESCIEVLERGRDKAARQLNEFLNTRRAIKAYLS